MVPSKTPVVGSNALISLALKLKLPTRRSPPSAPKLFGAKVNAPGGSELAAGDQPLQVAAVFVIDIDKAHSGGSPKFAPRGLAARR